MKRTLKIIGIVIAVILVALIALPFGLDVNSFRPKLESGLSSALGRQVKVGNLKLSLLTGSVTAEDLSIADDPSFSRNSFVQAKSLKVGVEIWPLIFSKTLHVTELTLQQPEIALIHDASGQWNFSSLGGSSGAASAPAANTPSGSSTLGLSVKKLNVKDGRISITQSARSKTRVYNNVNIEVRNFAFTAQFPFTVSADLPGGGSLKLEGQAGPIHSSDTSLTPLQAKIHVEQLDVAASGIADFSPGLAGLANFDGEVSSDGQQARATGTLQAEKLKLVQNGAPAGRPVTLKYALTHGLHNQAGTLSEGDITMGKALAQLTGSYQTQGTQMLLNMKLNAQAMPVDDLEAMLPALGVVLPSGSQLRGGTLSANLTITGPADNPIVTGPIRLSNSKLAGFDLGSKLSAISKLGGSGNTGSDTSIQNFSADARVAPDGTRGENINLTVPAFGVLTGSGTISPGGELDFKMTANLTGSVSTAATQLAHLGNQGLVIPFFIRGTASKPSFVPDAKGMVKSTLTGVLSNKLNASPSNSKSTVIDKFTGLFHRKKKSQ
ncbi:MAG TPA: AsmA family protein [Terriglobales bacterium]|nr:AsmA family protein [Terriglobales bacterium]